MIDAVLEQRVCRTRGGFMAVSRCESTTSEDNMAQYLACSTARLVRANGFVGGNVRYAQPTRIGIVGV
jgi:hypothetical protein